MPGSGSGPGHSAGTKAEMVPSLKEGREVLLDFSYLVGPAGGCESPLSD